MRQKTTDFEAASRPRGTSEAARSLDPGPLRRTVLEGIDLVRRAFGSSARQGLPRFRRLCADLPRRVESPVFVKVGANDGLSGDPCSDILLADPRWRGLLIEPVPYLVERLRRNFADADRFRIESVAIAARPGRSTFYLLDPEAARARTDLPAWYDQIGSFDREHILRHLGAGAESLIREREVEVVPLSALLDRLDFPRPHLLHVDTEGFDLEVLRGLDFDRHGPLMILVEHKHLGETDRMAMRDLLRGRGYQVLDCGNDFYARHRSGCRRLRRESRSR